MKKDVRGFPSMPLVAKPRSVISSTRYFVEGTIIIYLREINPMVSEKDLIKHAHQSG